MAQKPVTINSTTIDQTSTKSYGRAIAVDSAGNLHAVWAKSGSAGIFYAKSTDGGVTWTDGEGGGSGTSYQVSSATSNQSLPAIAIDSNDYLHIVWQDDSASPVRINYRRRTTSWQTEDTTGIASGTKALHEPNLVITSDDSLHVIGPNTTDNVVFWARSTDGGASWTLVTNQITSPTCQSGTKWGFDRDGSDNLHLVYVKNDGGTYSNRKGVYVKAAFSAGPTWSWGSTSESPWGSTAGRADDSFGLVVEAGGPIHVVYARENTVGSNRVLKWSRSTNGGTSWSTNATITGTETYFGFPSIGVDLDDVPHMVWEVANAFTPISTNNFHGQYFIFDAAHDKWAESNQPTGFRAWETAQTLTGGNTVKIRHPHLPRNIISGQIVIPAIYSKENSSAVRYVSFSTRKKSMAQVATNITNWKNTSGWGNGIVKTSDGKLHAVFVANSKIKYAQSADDGLTWVDGEGGAADTTFNLDGTNNTSGSYADAAVVIAKTDADDIHVVFEDGLASPITLKYRRRVGGTWQSTSTALQVASKSIRRPTIFITSDGTIHVFARNITDGKVYWAYSSDNGDNWTINSTLFNANTTATKTGADFDSDDNLHICWITSSTKVSYAKGTFSAGPSWSWSSEDSTNLNDTNTSTDPDLVVDRKNNKIYAAWKNNTTNHLRYNVNIAGSWGSIANLTSDTGDSSDRNAVNLAADGYGNIYAFWQDLIQISGINFRCVSASTLDADTATWGDEHPAFDFSTAVSVGESILGIENHPADDATELHIMGDAGGTIGWMDLMTVQANPTRDDDISGNAHIKVEGNTSTIGGNAFINRAETISGNAHLLVVLSSNISGNSHIKTTLDEDIDGNAHIRLGGEVTIGGNAHILREGLSSTIDGNAVIKLVLTGTIGGNANIQNTVSDTINANATIVQTLSDTIRANAVIVAGEPDLRLFIG